MDKRLIFPVIMFTLAAVSFGFGIWQYVYAQNTLASSSSRMAYIMTTLEHSPVARVQKQQLYASIAAGLPGAPTIFGINFSGSFASQHTGDACTSDGQRAICSALKSQNTDNATMTAICGVCEPQ